MNSEIDKIPDKSENTEITLNSEIEQKLNSYHTNITSKECYPSDPREIFQKLKSIDSNQINRLIICLIIIVMFAFFNNFKIIGNPIPHNLDGKICYEDAVLDFLKPLNNYFSSNEHIFYRKFVTIAGSLSLDIVYLISYIGWMIYAVDWRYGWATMFFYGPRALLQTIVRLCPPDYLYFPNPGFPSIVVGYIQGSDFFFSGHVGFPLISAVEFYWLGKYKRAIYCSFVSLLETFIMLSSREHYTIDIIIGLIYSHYITLINYDWFESIYKINYLKELRNKNREELKRIGINYDVINK